MRIVRMLAVTGVALVGAALPASAQVVTRPVIVEGASETTTVNLTTSANVLQVRLRVPLSRAWGSLAGVYRAMALPVTSTDSTHYLLGGEEQRVRRVAGRSMAALFDCPGAYENLAATGDVYLTVRTQLVPAGDSAATAFTQISAYARSLTGGQRVLCSTRGQLERLLEQKLLAADSTAH